MPTFEGHAFHDCTALEGIVGYELDDENDKFFDGEKISSFFEAQASSIPFSYLARSPVSTLDDLKRSPPAGPAPFPKMASGDTPLHCACSNLNPADLPSIIEHVRLRASAIDGSVAQLERSFSSQTSRHRFRAREPHSPATTHEHVGGAADTTTANLLLRSFRSRRSSAWTGPPRPPSTIATTRPSLSPSATSTSTSLPSASSPTPTPPR